MQTVGNILWLIFVGIWLAIAFVVAGILMFVLIITIPATTNQIASQSPTKMSHRMLPSVCTVPLSPLPTGQSSQ